MLVCVQKAIVRVGSTNPIIGKLKTLRAKSLMSEDRKMLLRHETEKHLRKTAACSLDLFGLGLRAT